MGIAAFADKVGQDAGRAVLEASDAPDFREGS
jgi:hypothetical protein